MPDFITYPGTAVMVSVARATLPILLGDTPRVEDAALILSEFATNALLHSHSGDAGGEFCVGVDRKPGWARIELVDQGPAGAESPVMLLPADGVGEGAPADHGRGLLLVAALADRWGHDSQPGAGMWWAEISWEEE